MGKIDNAFGWLKTKLYDEAKKKSLNYPHELSQYSASHRHHVTKKRTFTWP